MRTELRRGRPFRLAVTAATVALLLAGVLLYAGCQSEQQAKQQQFKEQWTKIMDQFQAQVATDDKKATDLGLELVHYLGPLFLELLLLCLLLALTPGVEKYTSQ